jgi:hypothetical protein
MQAYVWAIFNELKIAGYNNSKLQPTQLTQPMLSSK